METSLEAFDWRIYTETHTIPTEFAVGSGVLVVVAAALVAERQVDAGAAPVAVLPTAVVPCRRLNVKAHSHCASVST